MRRTSWVTVLLPVLIVLVAAALRVWRLETVPLGVHNDEAWTGINAREVLRDGWIGPYLYPSGLGQPAGPVYFTALLFTVLPETTFTLRLSMALLGIATVAFTYAAVREMFDYTTAVFAAAVLAIMPWHLHLSRTAFMVGAWPCIEMATLWVLFSARKQPTVWRFAAVGALLGIGIYTYNAYPLFLPIAAVPFLYDLADAREPAARRRWVARTAAAALTALWLMIPMAFYAATHEEYFWHQGDVSVFNDSRWTDADVPGRLGVLVARGAEWGRGVVAGGRPDAGDALAEVGHPLLDPLTSLAAVAGLVMALRGWRRAELATLLAAVVIMPFGALLTIDDGLFRRTFGLAPFLATLAALPMAALWRAARAGGPMRFAVGALVVALAVMAGRNTYAYFGPLQHTQEIRYVYPYQLDAAARVIARTPTDSIAYLYSDRWGARFETIKWLAPGHQVVDRGFEFRKNVPEEAPLDLSADGERPTTFILLKPYLDR
jgi:4-amino-4-deoxy-L-arabinose transferase-like glycosyltransferase